MVQSPALLARPRPAGRLPAPGQPRHIVNSREKAAIIVRLLLAEGAPLKIADLPDDMQAALTQQMGQMRRVDRPTLRAVVEEFLQEMEQVGLSFPGGIEGALTMMDGHMSAGAASRLRRMTGATSAFDPWDRLNTMPVEQLLPALADESVEVAAVVLSKLPVPKAAALLGKLPGEKARAVAYAVSLTGNVDPDTVRRIGIALAAQLDAQPVRAFAAGAGERIGAILNVAGAVTRDDVLKSLEETDALLAEIVRRNIFTFEHVSDRLSPRDVPKVVRIVDQPVLVTALAAAQGNPDLAVCAEHILTNLSQRMAQGLREEMAARGAIKDKDGEEAMSAVVTAIRQLEGAGELVLVMPED
jgi:flagellar motor switch protein FliG